jgi:hypothetical protein
VARVWSLLSVAALAAACSGSPSAPSSDPPTRLTLGLEPTAWETISEPQPYLLRSEGGALVLDFPTTGSINYLYTPSPLPAVRGTLVVTVRVTTAGPVLFNSLDPQTVSCVLPSAVRPFFWANDNGNGSFDRWWSNPRAFTLTAGAATISVPLTPEAWSSVNGRFGNSDDPTRFQFERALLNVSRFGVTFGGGCSFGHGINVRGGSATFALTGYSIQ